MKIYLISVVFSVLITSIATRAMSKKMENEGYVSVKGKKPFVEVFLSGLKSLVCNAVPLFNIFLALFTIFGYENIYEENIDRLKAQGVITRPKENEPISPWTIENMPSESLNRTICYEKMTRAEKIAWLTDEKAKLLSEGESDTLEGPTLRRSPRDERRV